MHLVNKIFLGLIIVTAPVFFYFSARVLKVHQHWRDQIRQHEAGITAARSTKEVLVYGKKDDAADLGIRDWQLKRNRIYLSRGRVWKEGGPWPTSQPRPFNEANGQVSVRPAKVEDPSNPNLPPLGPPNADPPQTELFVFRMPDKPDDPNSLGVYLGNFVIEGVGGTDWQLTPTRTMDPQDLEKLRAARGAPWAMYEKMPSADPDIAAEIAQTFALPPDKQGHLKPIDYRQIFEHYNNQRTVLADLKTSETNDLDALKAANAEADAEQKAVKADIEKYTAELAEAERHRDAVVAHLASLDQALAQERGRTRQLYTEIQRMAGELTVVQADAAKRIDQRTRMVQTGAKP